ncbi:MAG TPA: fenitrothion hydrolase, partial [Solirubrobacteraceae bacterium]|nr:fenitrothion hydrolase [Solirubrobacteraceae bacterium]
ILGFGICELCWATAREPAPLAVLMLAYVVVMLVGMSLYGVEAWTRNADAFGVYFGMFAALAPLVRRDGVLYARPPVVGAGRIDGRPGTAAVLLGGIGVTAFDGASAGPLFNDALPHLQDFFGGLGLGPERALELGFVVGMLCTVALVSSIWTLAVAGMPRVAGTRPGRRLVHSLVPILAAYVVAHYFSLLAYNGQDLWRLASDPLGDGSDLFGGAGATIDYGIVSATAIWYVQVGALVLGHVAALVLAHDRALVIYGSHRDATRSQLVMLVLMVCFTCLGLWLLSAANG